MNALDALKIAQEVGVRVRIDGEDLVLEALAAPPPTVIDLLSRYKVSILQKLREVAIDTAPVVPAFENPQESFSFTPPGDSANDDEALLERVAIMVESGMDEATALQEARWNADRERCWRGFLRNAQRVLDASLSQREDLLAQYRKEAIRRYGDVTGDDMADSLRAWVTTKMQ